MILARNPRDMLDMRHQLGPARLHIARQKGHEVHPDHPALVGHHFDRRIVGVTDMVVQRPRPGMADHQRPSGHGRRLGHRPLPAVAQVEQQFLRFDPLDRCPPQLGKAGIGRLQRPVARQVAVVVGQLDGPDPVLLELRQPVEFGPDHACVLGIEHHREFLLALALQDIRRAFDVDHPVGIGGEEGAIIDHRLAIVTPRVGDIADRVDGHADRGNPGRHRLAISAVAPAGDALLGIGIAHAAQCIDHDRARKPVAAFALRRRFRRSRSRCCKRGHAAQHRPP